MGTYKDPLAFRMRPLTVQEKTCLHCPYDRCAESETYMRGDTPIPTSANQKRALDNCPYHTHRQRKPGSKWAHVYEIIDRLAPDSPHATIDLPSKSAVSSCQSSITTNAHLPPGHKLRTYSQRTGLERFTLHIELVEVTQ